MKKITSLILSVLLMLSLIPAALAEEPTVTVTPSVTNGTASIEGDTILLIEGTAATIAFTPNPDLDIIGYQYGNRMPEGADITDATPFEGDYLIPTYTFGALSAGTYFFDLNITKNPDDPEGQGDYPTVFTKEYTVQVIALPQDLTLTPDVQSGSASISGDVITLRENTPATIAFTPGEALDSLLYQAGYATASSLSISDVTPLEDTLVPTYAFGELAAGDYEFTLTVSENIGYGPVFQKTYKLVVEKAQPEVTVVPGPGAPAMDIATPHQQIVNMLLSAEEIAAGVNIDVHLEAFTPSASVKEQFASSMSGYTAGLFLDLSLFKVKGDDRQPVTATSGMIRYTIDIPQSLLAQGRTFAIFREHDGVITKLADLDDNPATYTFETNVYSTYVLGYQDEEPAPVTVPKTGDAAMPWNFLLLAAVSIALMLFSVKKFAAEK